MLQILRVNNSIILKIKNTKLSGYLFDMNTNIQGDFQICIQCTFKCLYVLIYKAAFTLISAGIPTEENHDVFFYLLFSQILMFHRTERKKREPFFLVLSTTSTNIQTFICSFASCLIHTNIYVSQENRNTRPSFDIMYT